MRRIAWFAIYHSTPARRDHHVSESGPRMAGIRGGQTADSHVG
jgi:hypothetical protein